MEAGAGHHQTLLKGSDSLAIFGLAAAILGLIGHAFAIPQLYSLHQGFQAMSLVTATGLSIAACTQLLHRSAYRSIATVLSFAGIAIGAIILASHALMGADMIDPAVASVLGLNRADVGRTSVGSAIGILLLSFTAHPAMRKRQRLHDVLVAVTFFIAMLAIAGYAYSSADLYALPFFRTMALNTAVTIMLLSCAAILGRPDIGWGATISEPGAAGRATRRQLLFLVFPPVVGWFLVQASNAGHLRLGSAMALLVVVTVAPLLFLILHDGRALAALARERSRRESFEAEHLAVLEEKLAGQAVVLGEQSQARLLLAEEATQRSEGRYRSLFDSIDAGFCVIEVRFDDDGNAADYRFVEVNRAFEANTGLADAEGKWMRDLAPDHEQHWFDIYGKVAKTGQPIRFENPALALDDRWYDVHAFQVDDPALNRVGLLFNDISDRRRAEQALREINATLEQRVVGEVAEREQAQAAMRQSQKMEALGQLTGGVAHDFNNLLTPIVGTLDLLARRGSVTDREKRLLEGAIQSAGRATTLVQRLLAFARRQPLQTGPVDVRALIEGMADLVISTSGPQIRVVVDAPSELPPALADAHQLEMAILNLCVNARDAMPEGGTLTIAASEEPSPADGSLELAQGRYVRLIVADTGTGMAAETLKRATEPFYSTKGVGKGTGLGLSMVHGLMGQLGGALDIKSSPGLGTRIDLWLPLSDDLPKTVEAPLPIVEDASARGRVLVVDDEVAVRATTADMLQDLGYQTVELGSAREAQALLAEEAFDVVVTDHLMPGMTGAELALSIRHMRPGLPVLLVSGYANVEDVAQDIPRLAKPFRQEDLKRALAELGQT